MDKDYIEIRQVSTHSETKKRERKPKVNKCNFILDELLNHSSDEQDVAIEPLLPTLSEEVTSILFNASEIVTIDNSKAVNTYFMEFIGSNLKPFVPLHSPLWASCAPSTPAVACVHQRVKHSLMVLKENTKNFKCHTVSEAVVCVPINSGICINGACTHSPMFLNMQCLMGYTQGEIYCIHSHRDNSQGKPRDLTKFIQENSLSYQSIFKEVNLDKLVVGNSGFNTKREYFTRCFTAVFGEINWHWVYTTLKEWSKHHFFSKTGSHILDYSILLTISPVHPDTPVLPMPTSLTSVYSEICNVPVTWNSIDLTRLQSCNVSTVGLKGAGKTVLLKYAINYLYSRRKLRYWLCFYLDLDPILPELGPSNSISLHLLTNFAIPRITHLIYNELCVYPIASLYISNTLSEDRRRRIILQLVAIYSEVLSALCDLNKKSTYLNQAITQYIADSMGSVNTHLFVNTTPDLYISSAFLTNLLKTLKVSHIYELSTVPQLMPHNYSEWYIEAVPPVCTGNHTCIKPVQKLRELYYLSSILHTQHNVTLDNILILVSGLDEDELSILRGRNYLLNSIVYLGSISQSDENLKLVNSGSLNPEIINPSSLNQLDLSKIYSLEAFLHRCDSGTIAIGAVGLVTHVNLANFHIECRVLLSYGQALKTTCIITAVGNKVQG